MVAVTTLALLGFLIGFLYGISRRSNFMEALAYGVVMALILPAIIFIATFWFIIIIIVAIIILVSYLLGWKPL